jgi:outer membrane protein OmpA-like peptidoglycan-associated protein
MPASRSKNRGPFLIVAAGAIAILSLAPAAVAQDAITVQLLTPLSAASNHKGDAVRATVVSPAAFQGDTVQGQLTDVKASRGQSILQFTFVGLLHKGVLVPVASTVTSIANSHGQAGVDEQGHPIAASNPAPSASQAKSRIGSSLGGMLGGSAGGAVSDASNTSSTPPVPHIHVVSQGPGLDLAVGTTIGLSVYSTGQQSLASLPPNAPADNPSAPAPVEASTASGSIPVAAAGAAASSTAGGSAQPELKSVKIDFVPGEKTVFYDDFSDAAEDEPPPHWKVRGDPIELRVGGGIRQLTNIGHSNLTSAPIDFPASFTVEMEIKFPTKSESWPGTTWVFQTKDGQGAARLMLISHPDSHTVTFAADDSKDRLGGKDVPNIDFNQPIHAALWSQNGRFRVYVNGERVLDVNATTVPPPSEIYLEFNPGAAPAEVGIRRVRVAESAPDFAAVIGATGKYVTHGINFDNDGDRLKPESAPVLKQIVAGLEKNPNLKLEIDGYTDSVGDAAHNLDLSQRRAEAVRSVLVSQFGVDAARLTSNGFGAAQPIGSNDTPDGRAQNRRVEFVKQ